MSTSYILTNEPGSGDVVSITRNVDHDTLFPVSAIGENVVSARPPRLPSENMKLNRIKKENFLLVLSPFDNSQSSWVLLVNCSSLF